MADLAPDEEPTAAFDQSRFPVVIVNLSRATQVRPLLDELDKLIARGKRFVLIADGIGGFKLEMGALARNAVATYFKERDREIRTFVAGIITVTGSPLLRGAITAISWVRPAPVPGTVVPSMSDALLQAEKYLKQE